MRLFNRPIGPAALAALNDFGVQAHRFFGVHVSLLAPGLPSHRNPWHLARHRFCELIRKDNNLLFKCDLSERNLAGSGSRSPRPVQCHAGFHHLAIPIRWRGRTGGHLIFSPFRRPGEKPSATANAVFSSAWPDDNRQQFLLGPGRKDVNLTRPAAVGLAAQVPVLDDASVRRLERFTECFLEEFTSALLNRGFPTSPPGYFSPVRTGVDGEIWLSFFWTMFAADPVIDLATLRSWPSPMPAFTELVYTVNGPCEIMTIRRTIPVPKGYCILLPAGGRHVVMAHPDRLPLRLFLVTSLDLDWLAMTPVAVRHRLLAFLRELARETSRNGEYALSPEARMTGMQMVMELGQLAARPSSRRGRPPSVALGEAIERARRHLEISMDHPVTLRELAQKAGISRHTLEHRFHAEIGTSPIAFHRALRIGEARRLLATTRLSITAIAMRTGFSDPAHFSHVFTMITGRSPRRYRTEAISGNN